MKRRNSKISYLLLLGITFVLNIQCYAQNNGIKKSAFSIYYLCVGASDYSLKENAKNVFHSISGAKRSAKVMSNLLNDLGAFAGKVIVSDPLHPVTRNDVFMSLQALINEVDTLNSETKPLLIYYFCGHGLGGNYGWEHFSVPGDLNCQMHPLNQLSNLNSSIFEMEFWEEINRDDYKLCIATNDIVNILDQSKFQYLILLDNCYEGHELRFSNSSVGNLLHDTHNIFAFVNAYHQSNPVVFSTTPGNSVSTAQDPTRIPSSLSVGPICRRICLSYNASKLSDDTYTLHTLIKDLRNNQLDSVTKMVHCKAENIDSMVSLLAKQPNYNIKTEIIPATGGLCNDRNYDSSKRAELNSEIKALKINAVEGTYTYFQYSSSDGDHLGKGKNGYLNLKNYDFYIEEDNNSSIEINIEGNESWTLSFSGKIAEPLLVGSYLRAQRFNSADNPGLDISHDASGCNESKGEYTIRELVRDRNGKIISIAIDFQHFCDQGTGSLDGNLRINSKLE